MVTIKSQKEIEKMKEACRITASVYDEMYLDKNKTETMGRNGLKRIDELQNNWDNVVRRFTE